MRLTGPSSLSPTEARLAVCDFAAIAQSTLTMTPLGQLRYSSLPADEARQWLEAGARSDVDEEAQFPQISDWEQQGRNAATSVSYEHLGVRDLDLEPLGDVGDATSSPKGRIIAHAVFKYHPPPDADGLSGNNILAPHEAQGGAAPDDIPPSVNRELHAWWNNAVEAALHRAFGHMHCLEVRELATASSHLRLGIASSLMRWVFPLADAMKIPVVLAATPPGYPLYLKQGFVQLSGPDGVVECDMSKWGGSGVHHHILMIRHPK